MTGARDGGTANSSALRYSEGDYGQLHPTWHQEDGEGKAFDLIAGIEDAASRASGPMLSVLEVGCGTGAVLDALGRLLRQRRPELAVTLTGIDITPYALDTGRAQFPDLDLREADFLSLQGSFDCIVFCDVLEHLENPFAFLRHAGALAHTIVVRQPLQGDYGLFRTASLGAAVRDLGHISFFTSESFTTMADYCGWVPGTATLVAPWELGTYPGRRAGGLVKRMLDRIDRRTASFLSSGYYLNGSFHRSRPG